MDINNFCVDFINKNVNSQTNTVLFRLERLSSAYEKFGMFDILYWQSTEEGFYYFYFLQIRFCIQLTKYLFKEKDKVMAKRCLSKAFSILDYSHKWERGKNGKVSLTRDRYYDLRFFYEKTLNRLKCLIG